MSDEIKEWVKATKPANGPTIVTVTVMQGNLTAKYSTKAFDKIKAGVIEARARATAMLADLQEAMGDA